MNDREKMISSRLYNAIGKSLIYPRTKARMLADRFNKTHAWNILRRTHLIKKIFPNAKGKRAFFEPNIRVEYGFNVEFGDNFYMNYDCQLLDVAPIKIGDDVMFGPHVILATPTHPLVGEDRMHKQYPDGFHCLEYALPITIGNKIWLSANVVVLGGVTIGDNVVIGAGSVVTKDIPSNSLAFGVPCKVIRQIDENDRLDMWKLYEENVVMDKKAKK